MDELFTLIAGVLLGDDSQVRDAQRTTLQLPHALILMRVAHTAAGTAGPLVKTPLRVTQLVEGLTCTPCVNT